MNKFQIFCSKRNDRLLDGKHYKIIVGSVTDKKTCLVHCNDGDSPRETRERRAKMKMIFLTGLLVFGLPSSYASAQMNSGQGGGMMGGGWGWGMGYGWGFGIVIVILASCLSFI
jgi:hypothetical protein